MPASMHYRETGFVCFTHRWEGNYTPSYGVCVKALPGGKLAAFDTEFDPDEDRHASLVVADPATGTLHAKSWGPADRGPEPGEDASDEEYDAWETWNAWTAQEEVLEGFLDDPEAAITPFITMEVL